MNKNLLVLTCAMMVIVIVSTEVPKVRAYPTYSVNRDATNCRACHGDFRSSNYVSPVDGQNWGNLHNLHRTTMLSGDCDACHGSSTFPVVLDESAGGAGFQPIGCMGCHGRDEDLGHDVVSPGRGAGLRQYHQNSGITSCAGCHTDANPVNYTPVGEDVVPPYYFTPDAAHSNKPTNACNPNGEENYAGATRGLDNDGDGLADLDDSDCAAIPGDYDGDGDVDLVDYTAFAACQSGPWQAPEFVMPTSQCLEAFDFGADTDVDVEDFAGFQLAFNG